MFRDNAYQFVKADLCDVYILLFVYINKTSLQVKVRYPLLHGIRANQYSVTFPSFELLLPFGFRR